MNLDFNFDLDWRPTRLRDWILLIILLPLGLAGCFTEMIDEWMYRRIRQLANRLQLAIPFELRDRDSWGFSDTPHWGGIRLGALVGTHVLRCNFRSFAGLVSKAIQKIRQRTVTSDCPPEAAAYLLRLLPIKYRDTLADDVEEEFELVLKKYGAAKARRYYWAQTFWSWLDWLTKLGFVAWLASEIRRVI